jgi:alpha-ketoglutarate-dependent taurine dioxygenase
MRTRSQTQQSQQDLADAVTISRLPEYPKQLPIVLSPKGDSSLKFLTDFCQRNRSSLIDLLHKEKVILFRGFDLKTPKDFEDVALQLEPKLSDEYLGTSPRNFVKGTRYIFTASELPNFFPIPQHIEMSFLKSRPNKVFFFCETPPATGGQTPLADCGAVLRDMDSKLVQKLKQKGGVRYVRNYGGPKEWKLDPTQLKRWPEIFGTTDKKTVEETCKREGVELEWKKGDGIRLSNTMPATQVHPVTGEEVWCNHAVTFHPAMPHQEYLRIARYQGKWRFYFWALLAFTLWLLKTLFKRQTDFPLNTLFADGSVISTKEMTHMRDVTWKHTVFNKWRRGDVYMIDNAAASHGRMPYTGNQRRILVAWG